LDKSIPQAKHVSSFPQQLVVELEQVQDEDFERLLHALPDTIGCMNVGYINGTILSKKYARQKTPQPCELDGEYDDTDYLDVDNGGRLKPGILLECAGYVHCR